MRQHQNRRRLFVRRVSSLWLAALLLAVRAASAAPASTVDTISLRVEVYGLAGLHVLTLRSHIDQTDERYAITVDYATSGVAGLVIDLTSHAHVEGRKDVAAAQPELFVRDSKRSGEERHSRVEYRRDGSIDARST